MSLFSRLFSSRRTLLILLLIVCTFLSYSPLLKAHFLSYKDDLLITKNVNVQNFDGAHIKAILTRSFDHQYIPIPILSYSLERLIAGFNPLLFHLDNVLLHIAVVILVFLLAISFELSLFEAFGGALIFALNPLQVEVVGWLSQRKELLYVLFYLLSILYYRNDNFRLSLVFALLSMLSSAHAISLPLAIICMDWIKKKQINLIKYWPFLLIAFVFAIINNKAIFLSPPFLFRDHLFYLPLVMVSLFTAFWIGRLYRFLKTQEAILGQIFMAALATLLMGLSILTYYQCFVWLDTVSLWKHQLKLNPRPVIFNYLAEAIEKTPEYQQSQNDYRAYVELVSQGAAENKISIDKSKFRKMEEVIDLYKQAIGKDGTYMDSYLHLGKVYEDIEKNNEALLIYNKALEIDPKAKDVLFSLGVLSQKMNNPRSAIDHFNRLLKFNPEDEEIYSRIIKAYSDGIEKNPQEKLYQEQREEVLSNFEEISKRKKYTAADYLNLGFLYEQVGGFEEAIRFYKKSLELNPRYEKALLNLGNRYQQMGDLKSALMVYQQLLHFYPKHAQGYLNLGIIYNALSDLDRSRMFYQKAINLDPRDAKPYFYLGYLSESAGELKEALNYYEKSLEKDSQQAEAYYNMGNVYAQLGQDAEAMASYLKTVGINKNHQSAFVNLSILSFKSRDFAGAIHYLEEAQLLGYNPPVEYLKSLAPYRKK